MTRPLRCYVDTSVFGGVFDDQFRNPSVAFFQRVQDGHYTIVLSDETLRELSLAPAQVREILVNIPVSQVELVASSDGIGLLAGQYIEAGVLPPRLLADATHVAAATFASVDFILSWNFRHLVNVHRIWGYNAINERHGHRPVMIVSPLEISDEDSEDL